MARKILVVDDDKDLVQSIRAFLSARGYEVIAAHNGTEASRVLDAETPELIVLDIMMDSDTEGFHLAHRLKAEEATRRIPIIILSGFMNHLQDKYASFEFIMGRPWPAARTFEKPVNLKDLADSIDRILQEEAAMRAELGEA